MKICLKCKISKNFTEYHRDKRRQDGLSPYCKICRKQQKRENYLKYRENILFKQKNYQKLNPEKVKESKRKERIKNKDKYDESDKRWKENNSEKIKLIKKKYKQTPKGKIARLKYEQTTGKISHNLRSRLRVALKNDQKSGSAVKDLGISIPEFKIYIEAKFQPGMSWDNYGEWHLDHIKPLDSFDLSNREEFLKAANYTNYQPLWAIDNLKKSNKLKAA